MLLADWDQRWAATDVIRDTARCSRLDLFLDWQGGWHPAFTTEDENAFVNRVHADGNRRSTDRAVTEYEMGNGTVRIYNKTVQTKKEQKAA